MPYIGNPPAERYSKIAKQDLTGDGTVGAYTLDYAVGSVAEIEVFVNNVRQEPTAAYTVAGDQLTMTGAVASTDDFYVVFQGKAQQTVGIPEKQSNGDYSFDSGALFVDASTNQIGMGTTSPSTATGGGIDIEKAGGASVRLDDTTNTVTGELQVYSSGMNLATTTNHNIIISPNNSEVARFTTNGLEMVNGKGIYFGATADGSGTTSSELFDDYEEGTFNITVNSGVTSPTYSSSYGNYTKIGNLVYFGINLDLSGGSANGLHFTIDGLPFTSSSSGYYGGAFANYNAGFVSDGNVTVHVPSSSTEVRLFQRDGSTLIGTEVSNILANFIINGFYITD